MAVPKGRVTPPLGRLNPAGRLNVPSSCWITPLASVIAPVAMSNRSPVAFFAGTDDSSASNTSVPAGKSKPSGSSKVPSGHCSTPLGSWYWPVASCSVPKGRSSPVAGSVRDSPSPTVSVIAWFG